MTPFLVRSDVCLPAFLLGVNESALEVAATVALDMLCALVAVKYSFAVFGLERHRIVASVKWLSVRNRGGAHFGHATRLNGLIS